MKEFFTTKRSLWIIIPLLILSGLFVINKSAQQADKLSPPTAIPPTQQAVVPATPTKATPPSHTPAPLEDFVHLAWFYKPPEEGQLNLVAQNFNFFILTYKDEKERDRLKSMGVKAPFSEYLLFQTINDPGSCEANPTGNQVAFKAGDFCQISKMHPDWFLLDQNGNRIQSGSSSYFMDPGNEGFRQFWLERARELQETYGWDSIFLDNVEASRSKLLDKGESLPKYPDDASYQRAVEGFLDYIRKNYFEPRGKLMYGNIVSEGNDPAWDQYLKYLDGAMIESFATDWSNGYRSKDDWEQQMDQVEKTLAQGKTLILVAQGQQDDLELQKFAFASYLLVNNGKAFFRYTHSDFYRNVWLYDNYGLNIGMPVGNRYKENDGWRRDFSNGYVMVDPGKHTAQIVVNQ
jgi:hypothetical protein